MWCVVLLMPVPGRRVITGFDFQYQAESWFKNWLKKDPGRERCGFVSKTLGKVEFEALEEAMVAAAEKRTKPAA